MITEDQAVGLFNVISGLVFVVLGIFAASVRPRQGVNMSLGVFAASFGIAWMTLYSGRLFDLGTSDWLRVVLFAMSLAVSAISLLRLVRAFPVRVTGRDWQLLLIFIIVSGLLLAIPYYDVHDHFIPTTLERIGRALNAGAFWTACVLLALRFGRTSPGPPSRAAAIVAAALLLWPAMVAGMVLGNSNAPGYARAAWGLLLVLVALLWLRNVARRNGNSRTNRNLAFLTLGVALANMLIAVFVSVEAAGTWSAGTARLLAVAILTYGIMQHQLLGIDVKVRWTISKTTLAGFFVAVFFIASEAAQEFFGATLENNYAGIVAAGALVFAIAPLSRFADRVAERAVPAPALPQPVGAPPDDLYRFAIRHALRDRELTREEELTLADLAHRLGVPHRRALEILDETNGSTERREEAP